MSKQYGVFVRKSGQSTESRVFESNDIFDARDAFRSARCDTGNAMARLVNARQEGSVTLERFAR